MAGRLPFPYPSVFDANGNPLSGAKLNFYQSGTSTPLNTFSDAALSIPNANPVVADSAGRFSDIFLGDGPYKVVLSTSAAVVQWTADPVYAPSNVSGLLFDLPTVGGSANAITLTYTRPPIALTAGLRLQFKATASNTTATQITVNGLTAKNVFRQSGASLVALTGGEIQLGQIIEVEYDGTQFQLLGQMPGLYLITTKNGAGLSSVVFTSSLDSTFDEYLFVVSNLLPATNATDLYARISQDAGVTYKAGATDYRWAVFATSDAATNASVGSAGDTKISLATGFSNTAGHVMSGEVRMFNPSLSAVLKSINSSFGGLTSGGTYAQQYGGGAYIPDGNLTTGIQFFFSSGNISSGTFSLYGVRK